MAEETEQNADAISQVDRLNEIAAKGPLAAALNPVAAAIGQDFLAWYRHVSEKQKKNLQDHVEAVKNKNPNIKVEDDPLQQKDLFEWAKEASSINKDNEMSAIWRGILEDILNDKDQRKRIIEISKNMDADELKALKAIINTGKSDDVFSEKRLLDKGVIAKNSVSYILHLILAPTFVSIFIAIYLYSVFTARAFITVFYTFSEYGFSGPSNLFVGILYIVSTNLLFFLTLGSVFLVLFLISRRLLSNKYISSRDGKDIYNMYLQYSSKNSADAVV